MTEPHDLGTVDLRYQVSQMLRFINSDEGKPIQKTRLETDTLADCIIRALRELIELKKPVRPEQPFQVGDLVIADQRPDLYGQGGRVTDTRWWEFPAGCNALGVWQIQIDKGDWIGASHFRLPDSNISADKLLKLESQLGALAKSIGDSHSTATEREFSTCDVLRNFEERLKQLELGATENRKFFCRHTETTDGMIRDQNKEIAKQAELVNLRFDNLTKSIADLGNQQGLKIEELEHDVSDILIRMPDSPLAEPSPAPIFEVGDLVECVKEIGADYEAWHKKVGDRIHVRSVTSPNRIGFLDGLGFSYANESFKLIAKAKKPESKSAGQLAYEKEFSTERWNRLPPESQARWELYVAENPSDDTDPITEEWLRLLGFEGVRPRDGYNCLTLGYGQMTLGKANDHWMFPIPTGYIPMRTRKQVRMLAELWGIELKETK